MRLRLARLALVGVVIACARGEVVPPTVPPTTIPPTTTPPPTPEPRPPRTEPAVRVGILVDSATAEVSATTRFDLASSGDVLVRSEAGERWTFRAEGDRLRATSSAGRELGPAPSPLVLSPSSGGLATIAGKNYRGSALLRISNSGNVTAINVLDLEEYLKGVVPFEIGRLSPTLIEAVKAQAIAARTYAIGNLNRWGERGFDFVATVQDQVYGGMTGEDSVASRAVMETRGEILTYDGQPIIAYYSSTCGGRTANLQDSWPWGKPQPYLKSVSDSIPGGSGAYCETSSRFRWNVSWTAEGLKRVLRQTLSARQHRPVRIDRLEDIEMTGRNQSGRAESIRIYADGETHEIRSDSIRWILKPDSVRSLNSSLLLDFAAHRENGEVTDLQVAGAGWGHGIGMCQVGAIGRARAGQNYRDILTAYYSDTTVDRLY
jgi:stage II sporulation protein D